RGGGSLGAHRGDGNDRSPALGASCRAAGAGSHRRSPHRHQRESHRTAAGDHGGRGGARLRGRCRSGRQRRPDAWRAPQHGRGYDREPTTAHSRGVRGADRAARGSPLLDGLIMLATLRALNNQLFHRIRLTTKLVIMLLALLVLSLTASIMLSYLSQQALVQELEDSINELSNATAVSVEQLSGEPDPAALQKLMARLGKKGVKEIKLLDVEKKEVLVSAPPQADRAERKIASTLTQGGKREYDVTAPLVDGNEVLGYIHVTFT